MTKKFLSALLAVLMVVSMVPMAAMAATEDQDPLAGLEVTEAGFFANADNFKSYINGTYYLNNGTGVNDVSPNTVFVRMNKAVPDGYGLYMLVQAFDSEGNRVGSNAKAIKSPNSFACFANDAYASATRIAALIGIYELDSNASDQNTQFGDSSFDSIRWSTESGGWKAFPNGSDGKPTYGNSKNWNIPINTTKAAAPCVITLTETGLTGDVKGTIAWTNATTADNKTTAKIGAPVEFTVTAPTDYTVKSVKLNSEAMTADEGKYKFVVTGNTAAIEVAYESESTTTPDADKEALVAKIVKDMGNCSPVDGAPLHDTRTEEQGGIPDEELYTAETYTVTVTSSDLQPYDLDVNVAAKGLKGHQNADSPASMGYWVGVRFPVVDGWTITKYKREKHAEVAIADADLTTDADGNKKTLNAYYNAGDASEDVENPRQRPVTVTYKKDGSEKTVDVKFLVKLAGVEIVVPAAKPEENGTLSEQTQKDITSAITAAATGSSENHEDTEVADTQPTVSVKTATSGTVTINKEIVEALKEVAEDNATTNVDLKIVGNDGAEATIPATTAKTLDATKDLKPTVKAETTTDANVAIEGIDDEATKAIVTQALDSLGSDGKYVVTVTMEQDSKLFTDPASCEITVKVPVPSAEYDTVIHIGDDGNVTKEPATKGVNEDGSYFLTVTLNHLSQVFGAKSSEVSDIPVDPGELGAAAMPMVTYTKLADMTGAVTGVNGTINKDDVYNESGVLVVKNTSEATQRYIISVGPKATANSFNIAYVAKLEKNQQYVIQCQQTLAVKVVGVGMTTNLNEQFKMEDFDVDGWVNVTDAAASYPGVTAD